MQETLAHLDERQGGVEAYLRASGVAAGDSIRLHSWLRG